MLSSTAIEMTTITSSTPSPTTPEEASPAAKKGCCGRFHCIQVVTGSGVPGGAFLTAVGIFGAWYIYKINEIATYFFGSVAVYGAYSLVKDSLATCYLCAWKTKHDLEQTVEQTTKAVESFKTRSRELEQELQKFRTTTASQSIQLAKEIQTNATLQETVQKQIDELKKSTSELQRLTAALDQANQLKSRWQKLARDISKQIASLHGAIKQYAKVHTQITNLTEVCDEVQEATKLTEEISLRISEVTNTWETFSQQFTTLKADFSAKEQVCKELQSSIETLQTVNRQNQEEREKLAPILTEFHALVTKYTKARKNFDQVAQEMQKITALPETASLAEAKRIAQQASSLLRTLTE